MKLFSSFGTINARSLKATPLKFTCVQINHGFRKSRWVKRHLLSATTSHHCSVESKSDIRRKPRRRTIPTGQTSSKRFSITIPNSGLDRCPSTSCLWFFFWFFLIIIILFFMPYVLFKVVCDRNVLFQTHPLVFFWGFFVCVMPCPDMKMQNSHWNGKPPRGLFLQQS